jgi:hypothetical protein
MKEVQTEVPGCKLKTLFKKSLKAKRARDVGRAPA